MAYLILETVRIQGYSILALFTENKLGFKIVFISCVYLFFIKRIW